MSNLSPADFLYPVFLLLASAGFWSVLRIRPDKRSAMWFAIAYVFGALAFGFELFRFSLPDPVVSLIGGASYHGMSVCFVFGLIMRAGAKPPMRLILAIATVSTLASFAMSLLALPQALRFCATQFLTGTILLIGVVCSRTRWQSVIDKLALFLTSALAVTLMAQPFLVFMLSDFAATRAQYDASILFTTIRFLVGIASLITAMVLVCEYLLLIISELRNLANRDNLTGLFNRRGFDEEIHKLVAQTESDDEQVAFILLDIDHFKQLNDDHGHAFGDNVLRALGVLLNAHKSPNGLAARIGGEEFLLAFPTTSLEAACAQAELVRERWERHQLFDEDGEVSCTASFGVSLHLPGTSILDAVARADQALYGAKQTGRNRVKSQFDLQVAQLRSAASQMAGEVDASELDGQEPSPQTNS